MSIRCRYCGCNGQHSDVKKGGWILSKNAPFQYACSGCAWKDHGKQQRE